MGRFFCRQCCGSRPVQRLAMLSVCSLAVLALASPLSSASAGESPYVAPKDKGVVVFIRDRFVDRKINYVIVDADRQCLGVMDDKKAELIPMKPGKHTLYALGGNARRVEVNVEAGRTYFVRIYSHTAMAKGMVGLTAARRGTEAFEQIPTWTKDLKNGEGSDSCRGTTVDDKRGRIQKRIDRTDADWKGDSEEERAKFTLKKKDGLTAKEAAKL
jgi:hypothetical protein